MARSRRESPAEALEGLRADLADGQVEPFYLIHGDAGFLKREALQAIEAVALGDGPPSFNLDRFEGADCDIDEVLTAAMMLPMMAPRRLVILKGFNRLDDKSKKAIIAYVQAPNPTTTLLTTAGPVSGRPAWLRELSKGGRVVGFRGLYESEMPTFIGAEARLLKKRISHDAIRYVKEMVGTNLGEVRAQLTKAALYVGEKETLDVADLEAVVSDISLDTVFAFTDSVGKGDVGEAMLQLDRLMTAEPFPARLLAMLHRHFRQLAAAHELLVGRGQAPDEVADALGIKGGRLHMWRRNFLPQIKGWSADGLSLSLRELQQTHQRLRSAIPPDLAMERTVLRLCELRGRR